MGAAEGGGEEVGVGSQMGGGSGEMQQLDPGGEGPEGVFRGGGAAGGHRASAVHGAPSFIAEGTGILAVVIGQV
jgi:hypothetical protein